jgi:glycopeptide antibiotics resistance protein
MIPSKIYAIIYDIMPMIILFIIMAILLKVVTVELGKNKGNSWTEFKFLCYIIYSFVLFELVTTTDFTSYSNNFIPFKEIMRYEINTPLFIRNIIGNIALFIPFSYIVTDVINVICKKTNFFISTIYVLLTSLSIEVIQYFIGRSFDIDDIMLNFVGGILGYIIYKLIHIHIHKKVKKDE